MASGIAHFVLILAIYALLLGVQQLIRKNKYSWAQLRTQGDPWFFVNVPVSVCVGAALGPRWVAWL